MPGQFRFAVKMRRTITHEARLHHADTEIAGFFDEVAALGTRLGVVLVQLPPSLRFDAAVAEDFFERVRRRFEGAIALEPRHRSWFDSEAEAVCIDHRIARVAADPAPVPLPAAALPGGAAEPRYWRWHGSPRIYYSAYGEARLRGLAEATANGDPERSWCIFDNTAQGHAIADALKLRDLFERAVSPHEALRA